MSYLKYTCTSYCSSSLQKIQFKSMYINVPLIFFKITIMFSPSSTTTLTFQFFMNVFPFFSLFRRWPWILEWLEKKIVRSWSKTSNSWMLDRPGKTSKKVSSFFPRLMIAIILLGITIHAKKVNQRDCLGITTFHYTILSICNKERQYNGGMVDL